MKLFYKIIGVITCVCLACGFAVGCSGTVTVSADELSYVSMRINPEIEIVVDKDGVVVAVNAVNADGETVLAGLNLVGLPVGDAAEAFTDAAAELGFMDIGSENATVYISAGGKDERFVKELEEKITEKVNGFFNKNGIFGKVEPEDLQEFQTLADELGVSLQDARLISRVLELYPELTAEEVAEKSPEEMLDLIKDYCKNNGIAADLREEYKGLVDELKSEFERLFQLEQQLREVKAKLDDETLTEEERAAAQAEYDALKEEYDALKDEYKAAVEELKEQAKEKTQAIKDEIRERAEQRREEFAEIIREHEEKFNEQKEEIERSIKEWRDSFDIPEQPYFPIP